MTEKASLNTVSARTEPYGRQPGRFTGMVFEMTGSANQKMLLLFGLVMMITMMIAATQFC